MIVQHSVKFSVAVPSISDLLLEIEEISGVPVFFEPKQSIIYSNKIRGCVSLSKEEYRYDIFEYSNKTNYLTGITLFALLKLGGEFNAKLPSWVNKPWRKIKIIFFFLPRKIIYAA